ncbi:unnamed protein product [Moneuplotes crassus]|uniref:Uncharacterized protein n=1 Tax=Euplotes crassus TaxID=5936 RepID=A0AAD1X5G9_EUPCR|nr:unnamed protein product [Moneuplotes crassus]
MNLFVASSFSTWIISKTFSHSFQISLRFSSRSSSPLSSSSFFSLRDVSILRLSCGGALGVLFVIFRVEVVVSGSLLRSSNLKLSSSSTSLASFLIILKFG